MPRSSQPGAGGASVYVRPNDAGIGDDLERGLSDAPYPTQSKVPQRRCFLLAAASVYQWLGLSLGGWVSLAADAGPDAPLWENPWMVGFVLLVVVGAVLWYAATRNGNTTGTFCCNWEGSPDFRSATADLLVVAAGYGLGVWANSAVASGGAIVGGVGLGLFAAAVLANRYCCSGSGSGAAA